MPDQATSLERFHRIAVSELEDSVFFELKSRPLLTHELACYKGRFFSQGWRFRLAFSDCVRSLDFLIDKDCPFIVPSIALVDCPPFLTWPHIEEDGILCLLPNSAETPYQSTAAVARSLIIRAHSLIEDCIARKNQDDFIHEFYSYWTRTLESGAKEFISLVEPTPPSRLIKVWKGRQFYLLGEDENSMRRWFVNRFGERENFTTHSAGFIWIAQPLHPSQYPKKNSDIWNLALAQTGQRDDVLRRLVDDTCNEIPVIIGAPSDNGPCLAGITASQPFSAPVPGRTKDVAQQGFRPSKIPATLLASRYWNSSAPVSRSNVVRADHTWIHGRGRDERQKVLASSNIVIIGCGSIGGFVATTLAMAGVGNMLLIDPERLVWANISRHFLGAKYVDQFKAESLVKELRENYPHQLFDSRNEKWQTANRKEPELLTSRSLIINTTGNWGAESALNVWHQSRRSIPIVSGRLNCACKIPENLLSFGANFREVFGHP